MGPATIHSTTKHQVEIRVDERLRNGINWPPFLFFFLYFAACCPISRHKRRRVKFRKELRGVKSKLTKQGRAGFFFFFISPSSYFFFLHIRFYYNYLHFLPLLSSFEKQFFHIFWSKNAQQLLLLSSSSSWHQCMSE